MSDIKRWSTTAASNNSAPPDGAPEGGVHFSEINDIMREQMAAIRRWYETAQWTDFGHTVSFISGTSFKIAGQDVRSTYEDGRRLLAYIGTGTIYGDVLSTTFAGGDTTITVRNDSGALDSSLSSVAVGILTPSGGAMPGRTILGVPPNDLRYVIAPGGSQSGAAAARILAAGAGISLSDAGAGGNLEVGIVSLSEFVRSAGNAALDSVSVSAIAGGSASFSALTVGGTNIQTLASRAWVKVAMSATAASIQAAVNVTTVSAIGTGRWRVEFTTPPVTTGYCYNFGVEQDQGVSVRFIGRDASYAEAAGSIVVCVINSGGAYTNPGAWTAAFFW